MAESEEIFTTMIAKQAEKNEKIVIKSEKQERTKDSEGNKNESECQSVVKLLDSLCFKMCFVLARLMTINVHSRLILASFDIVIGLCYSRLFCECEISYRKFILRLIASANKLLWWLNIVMALKVIKIY